MTDPSAPTDITCPGALGFSIAVRTAPECLFSSGNDRRLKDDHSGSGSLCSWGLERCVVPRLVRSVVSWQLAKQRPKRARDVYREAIFSLMNLMGCVFLSPRSGIRVTKLPLMWLYGIEYILGIENDRQCVSW
jgi:hypothetical protein